MATDKFNSSLINRTLSIVRQPKRLLAIINTEENDFDVDQDFGLVITHEKQNSAVSVDHTGNLNILEGVPFEKPVHAILGIIPIFSSTYLLVVTEKSHVGALLGRHNIYGIKHVEFISIAGPETTGTEEKDYIDQMTLLLESGTFYYSYTYDLSHSLERQNGLRDKKPVTETPDHLWKHQDERFVWNLHLVEKFQPFLNQFGYWIPPIIQGFAYVDNRCKIDETSTEFGFAVLSRRNKNRAGTRYHTRGADPDGNVAAYVETEQILQVPSTNTLSSFIQIRGSIPLLWKQDINLQYEPPIDIDVHKSDLSVKLHFEEQLSLYKKQVLVNLVKKKGAEGPLGKAYKQAIRGYNNPNVKYVGFDVYQHCKTSNYDKLSLLVEKIQHDFKEMGYFRIQGNQVVRSQLGVFRTNCKDCLDRTNLVQGLFARLNLIEQLKDFGIINDEDQIKKNSPFMVKFRSAWADNGDAISIIYAGTPALKGDVTRTGKRSFQGMIDDGFNAITRYYINNFQDGIRQDSMDLLLGNVVPAQKSTRAEQVTWIVAFLLAILSFFGPGAIRLRIQMIIVAFVMLFVIITSKILRVSGKHVVNTPQLSRIKQKMG